MKKTLIFCGILMLIIMACSSEKMNFNRLQDRNGLFYLVNEDKPFSGEVISYVNGQTEFEGLIENGLRTGKWTYYYPTGQKKMEGNFNEGLKNGTWTYWKENGQQDVVEVYNNGKLLTNQAEQPAEPVKKDSVTVVVAEKETKVAAPKPAPPKESPKQTAVEWERLKGGPVKYLDGNPYSGPVVKHYSDGTKELDGYFSLGKRTGKWIFYDRHGNVKDVRYY